MIGKGAYGKVFSAQSKVDPDVYVAIKVLNKKKMKQRELKVIGQEVQILSTLDHPNIVKYFEAYEDENYLYLVMEQCKGLNLFDSLTVQ